MNWGRWHATAVGRSVALSALLSALLGCASKQEIVLPPPPAEEEEEPAAEPIASELVVDEAPKPEPRSDPELAKARPNTSTKEPPAEPFTELPQECATTGKLCLPPKEFTRRLCQDAFPGISIAMFDKHTKWTRGYVKMREIESVNTLGGPASDAKLVFAEELIILDRTGADEGQLQVSGTGGYLVLRWDGTCATLDDHELVTYIPAALKNAPIVWKYLDDNIQEALLTDERIHTARQTQRKHCRGVTLGRQKPACQKAQKRLNDTIVLAVRTGRVSLPTPERLP